MFVSLIRNYDKPINVNFNQKQKTFKIANLAFEKKDATLLAGTALAVSGVGAYVKHNGSYITQLAKDLSKELNKKITSKHLKSVMTKEQLLKELPKLKEQNYVASVENLKNGTFLADLHSHSKFSDGTIKIPEFLDQAAKYGDKLNKLNGKKFIVALSDHDGVEGVKEALKLIVQNPEKYKNIKFVPATELSFVMPTSQSSERFKRFHSEVEMPEMLIYNINPFSNSTKKFFDNLYKKRLEQIKNSIDELKRILPEANFTFEEYTKFFNPEEKYCFLNQHWKIWNYFHTKSSVAEIARTQDKNADSLYNEIFMNLKQRRIEMNPYSLKEYFKQNNIETLGSEINSKISEVLHKKYFPKKVNDIEVQSMYESKLDDLVKYVKEEDGVMGFAHPGFTLQNFSPEQITERMNYYIKKGGRYLKLIEKYHQAYPLGSAIGVDELNRYNKLIDDLKLIQMGGRDNHSPSLLPPF